MAEDHRNELHFGVDPIAILRSVKVRLLQGERQGASTIEQQLVRTITGRYEKTPRRKIREQVLAVMLNSRFSKSDMAGCYLKVAYYGVSLSGAKGVKSLRAKIHEHAEVHIVAHLKYPRTLNPEGAMARKHLARVKYIRMLLANNSSGLFLRKPTIDFFRVDG